jgi:hypothetical protein
MRMRQILESEDHVAVPPMMYTDPFYRITYLIKEEIRKYKWLEGEKGRALSWKEARTEWTASHRVAYEKFLVESLSFPDLVPAKSSAEKSNPSAQEAIARLSTLPHRTSR